MSTDVADQKAPLDEVMMAMDVVDTLRHRQDLALKELDGASKKERLIEKLREIYHNQGIDVPDSILEQGVAALEENRFVYDAPGPSFKRSLAEFYVARRRWGRPVLIVAAVLVLGLGAYFLAYLPYQAHLAEQARIELSETLPAQMQALRDTIFEETKVQTAVSEADGFLQRGQTAAKEGDRVTADAMIAKLTDLRDTLRLQYQLRVVNRDGVRSGFWTFPDVNEDATNYYLVVEAINPDGQALTLPILNEESGETERVAMWGLRVPEAVYNSVADDKQDDGIIEKNIVGEKEPGFLDVNYAVPVLGGAVTRW
ncbi:MAG: hypothetical protein H6873_04695 [Hyphomicrobiaceae bacterium]|nr:hypothetical protein [Hyphomicrobiaceae bacterium]